MNRIARALRKWADLIDPRTPPQDMGVLTLRIECDASPFEGTLTEIRSRLLKLAEAARSA
jgi:hypothetical protein